MKRNIVIILITFIILSPSFSKNDKTIDETHSLSSLLDTLDATIAYKDHYSRRQMEKVDSLIKLSNLPDLSTRYKTYWKIYDCYKRYQTDSALVYLNRLSTFPKEIATTSEKVRIKICEADIYGVTGMYNASLALLDSISLSSLPTHIKTSYYHTRRTVMGWLSDYTSDPSLMREYELQTSMYRDSILKYEEDLISRNIVLADKMLVAGYADDALKLLLPELSKSHDAMRRYIYMNIGEAYRQKGDLERYTYYLVLAAIDDLRSGVREYMALPTLARLMYDNGDIKRSYTYLTCSMEDATLCNARLRSAETSSIFPIIDKAYKARVESQHKVERTLTIVLILAIMLLTVVLLLLRHKNKELGKARQKLLSMNTDLVSANIELEQTDKIKEEYIAFFLDKCRSYLTEMEKYRQGLLKLAKTKQHEKLLKRLNSTDLADKEQQKFYDDFDDAFLKIHPNFVERFNSLLKPESRIELKQDNKLNTGLRIFALIRLGMTDSHSIAKFLNYSNSTVYNYRSRIRNCALDSDNFEEKVMRL